MANIKSGANLGFCHSLISASTLRKLA